MRPYNIGLDIGTTSVGWAVIDSNYKLIRKNKMNLLGAYLFEEGQTAAERRGFRSTRRRYRRRKQRLTYLDTFFKPAIDKVDPSFFTRLDESFLSSKDVNKSYAGSILFDNDQNFYHDNPTIYHLRSRLIHDKSQADIREVYLALHHIIKYRGNFIYEGQNLNVEKIDIESDFEKLGEAFDTIGQPNLFDTNSNTLKKVDTILKDNQISKSQKEKSCSDVLLTDKENKQQLSHLLKLVVGNQGTLNTIFNSDNILKDGDPYKLKLSDANAELAIPEIEEMLSDDELIIFQLIQKIYSGIVLNQALKGKSYLSDAQVESYETHASDLKALKEIWHQDALAGLHEKERKAARLAYGDYVSTKRTGKTTSTDNFYKEINKYLALIDSPLATQARKQIELNNYLPKQRISTNGVIPYQVHEKELLEIIDNQAPYYPFLAENKTKIQKLLNFRIPYYVGPLSDSSNPFSWVIRREDGPVRPWNFNEKINLEASSEAFIQRMVKTDTYLINEPVLAKNSLQYSKFEVLNELNKLRVNDKIINPEIKQQIFEEVFKTHKTVSESTLKTWFKQKGEKVENIAGFALEKGFAASLTSYNDYCAIFGQAFVENPINTEMIEELIQWQTIFEDKKALKLKMKKYEDVLSKSQYNALVNKRYRGWGRLSERLLNTFKGTVSIHKQEQNLSIMGILWQTNLNFMQIINDQTIGIDAQITAFNFNKEEKSKAFDSIQELATSPANKKAIHQVIKIVLDIQKIMKCPPDHIYLEFARSNENSVRTATRNRQILEGYGNLPSGEVTKELKQELSDNSKGLDKEKLYLYFIQNGKSLYSGKTINLDELNSNKYQVDHIIPRAYIKDDSLENKALVLQEENQWKKDNLLLESSIIDKNITWWARLNKAGLIGDKKFKNLTRRSFSENEQKGFINRQLVETRQIIKNVAQILEAEFQGATTVVSVKAAINHDFRKVFGFIKNRDVNDYHHAHDAYITAVMGNYILKRYPKLEGDYVYSAYNKAIEEMRRKSKTTGKPTIQESFIIWGMNKDSVDPETGEIIWQKEKDLAQIRKTLHFNRVSVVKKTEEVTGAIYNQTINKAKGKIKVDKLIPIKKDLDPQLYGGYSSIKYAYTAIIDTKKGNILIGVPVSIVNLIDSGQLTLEEYVIKEYPTMTMIVVPKINKYQLIKNDDGYQYIVAPAEVQNAQQLVLDDSSMSILKQANSYSPVIKQIERQFGSNPLLHVYNNFTDQLQKYYPLFRNELEKLKQCHETFKDLPFSEQTNILSELLKITQANSQTTNLIESINIPKRFGRKQKAANLKNASLIYQSPTGYFTHQRKI